MLHDGLYEQIINHKLSEELAIHEDDKVSQIEPIDEAEAPRVLADYIADLIEKRQKLYEIPVGISMIRWILSIASLMRQPLMRQMMMLMSSL